MGERRKTGERLDYNESRGIKQGPEVAIQR